MPAGTPSPPHPPTPVRHRREVGRLTTGQLADFRLAMHRAQHLSDDRGFQHWAGIHGLPLPISCTHHNDLFLPWHRAYLYLFEKTLQDRVAGVTLPWWDWTRHHDVGIPGAYTHRREPGGDPNPLFDSAIQPSGRERPAQKRTKRAPGADFPNLPTAAEINQVLANADFFTFQTQLESLHDGVHVWVGGTMGDIPTAAYDPVFWAHHSMIDRIWYLWQLRHHHPGPPASLLDRALSPFGLTVRDTLHPTTHLGYDYAASTAAVAGPGHHG